MNPERQSALGDCRLIGAGPGPPVAPWSVATCRWASIQDQPTDVTWSNIIKYHGQPGCGYSEHNNSGRGAGRFAGLRPMHAPNNCTEVAH